MTQQSPTKLHSAQEAPKRPRGILKNSFSGSLPTQISPPTSATIPAHPPSSDLSAIDSKEITLQNTLQNAGHRRSSSTAARASVSRRHSSVQGTDEENNPRLKWDEANLYLAEQEKSATMKITEPKTPYAKKYEPDEDEEDEEGEDRTIDAQDLKVDELDLKKDGGAYKAHHRATRDDEIPGLELGEPEETIPEEWDGMERPSSGGKHVVVGAEDEEEKVGRPSKEEMEKHREFEEARKKHYEMGSIKSLLGHPDEIDAMDEDSDEDVSPTMPKPRRNVINGDR